MLYCNFEVKVFKLQLCYYIHFWTNTIGKSINPLIFPAVLNNIIAIVTYSHACRNIVNTIKTSGHGSLEKYTSHFIWKGYERVIVWEVSWRLNKGCNILTPTLLAIAAFLSRSPGLLNQGPGGPASAGTWFSLLELEHWLQTLISNWLTCCRTRVIFDTHLLLVASQFALNSTRRQSRLSPDIFDQMHLLFTQMHFSSDSSARSEVNMLHYSSARMAFALNNPQRLICY